MQYEVTSSGLKSADAQICAYGSRLHSVQLISDGTNTCHVEIYDGTSNSGLLLAKLVIAATTAAPQSIVFNNPVNANTGIYADVTGTGAAYIVHYSGGN